MSQQVIIFDTTLRDGASVTGQPEREREAADCDGPERMALM